MTTTIRQPAVPELGQQIYYPSRRHYGRCTRTICRSSHPRDRGTIIPGLFLYATDDGRTFFGLSQEWKVVEDGTQT